LAAAEEEEEKKKREKSEFRMDHRFHQLDVASSQGGSSRVEATRNPCIIDS